MTLRAIFPRRCMSALKLSSLALLLVAGQALAADRAAATCSFADVTTAYNAAVDGDRVLIPAGTCTWNNTLTVSKGIQILGVSNASPVITGARFTVTVPAGKAWTIGQFRTNGTAGFNITGSSKAGRITAVYFDGVTGFTQNRIIWIEPSGAWYSTGVIDNVTFFQPLSIQFHVRESGNAGGNDSYRRPLDLGGPDAWYVEDSTFQHTATSYNVSTPATDCDGGGRYVVRYSQIIYNYTEQHDAIVGGIRGCRKFEIYNNTFSPDFNDNFGVAGIRGGTGVMFNNTITTKTFASSTTADANYSIGEFRMQTYRRSSIGSAGAPWGNLCSNTSGKICLNGSTVPTACTSDAQCGGQAGSCIATDGASSSPTGYPCRDQNGVSGNNPQFSRPVLFWNNRYSAAVIAPFTNDFAGPEVADGLTTYVQENRDFCVGRATMPTTCNGIVTRYTPYPYPHPLRTRAGPVKPTGGAVN